MSFVADIFGAIKGNQSAQEAANAQRYAADQSNQTQRYIYDTSRADNAPMLSARNNALTGLNGLMANPGSITSDFAQSVPLLRLSRTVTFLRSQ